jgi:dTDP-glucose pyrophosphorylase
MIEEKMVSPKSHCTVLGLYFYAKDITEAGTIETYHILETLYSEDLFWKK